jgi:hypothetical protein
MNVILLLVGLSTRAIRDHREEALLASLTAGPCIRALCNIGLFYMWIWCVLLNLMSKFECFYVACTRLVFWFQKWRMLVYMQVWLLPFRQLDLGSHAVSWPSSTKGETRLLLFCAAWALRRVCQIVDLSRGMASSAIAIKYLHALYVTGAAFISSVQYL